MSQDNVVKKAFFTITMLLATRPSWASRSNSSAHNAMADVSATGAVRLGLAKNSLDEPADAVDEGVQEPMQGAIEDQVRRYEEWKAEYQLQMRKVREQGNRSCQLDEETLSYDFFSDERRPGREPLARNWFKAKEMLMFRNLGEWYHKVGDGRITYEDVVRLAGQEPNPLNYAVSCMARLVGIRTWWICMVLLNTGNPNCLFDEKREPVEVPIPKRIEPQGDKIREATEFSDSQTRCTAKALGSVSVLSDLDFTIQCWNPKCASDEEEARQAAMDEILIAETFSRVVLEVMEKPAGILFDTNFYTDTFRYAPQLGTEADPSAGFTMAIYAAARGIFGATNAIGNWDTFLPQNMRNESRKFRSPYSIKDEITYILTLESFPKEKIQDVERYLSFALAESASPNLNDTNGTDLRTDIYYAYLREAVEAKQKVTVYEGKVLPGSGKNFRLLVAAGLIYANEAYWVEGAIKDVVFKDFVSNKMATESVLMNLGYSLEHLVGELEKAIHSLGAGSFLVMRAQSGDGLMKYCKYLKRIYDCWTKKGWPIEFRPAAHQMFEFARELLQKKKDAQKQEDRGNLVALAWAYFEASSNKFTIDRGPDRDIFVESAIRFVELARSANDEIIRSAVSMWTRPEEDGLSESADDHRISQREKSRQIQYARSRSKMNSMHSDTDNPEKRMSSKRSQSKKTTLRSDSA